MDGFTKLFTRILDSTVWREDDQTRLLWITMLALADRNGVVRCTIPGLADRARISLEQCERGLQRFQEPDKYSWSQVAEGRRIEIVAEGWRLINYSKYREMMVSEQHAERQRKYRERHAASRSVTVDNKVTRVTQAEAEAYAEANKNIKSKSVSHFVRPTIQEIAAYCEKRNNGIDPEKFFAYYESQGWYVGKKRMQNWKYAVVTWEKNNYGGPFDDGHKTAAQLRNERSSAAIDRAFAEDQGS